MADPKLVEEVLGEEWTRSASSIVVGVHEHLVPSRFALSNVGRWARIERARQAALGHRALRLLVGLHREHYPSCDCAACAIIRELRGEP